jgi:hypothetical protein
VAASHIHMTANRLGVNNAEEIYLLRLLLRAYNSLRTAEPGIWKSFRVLPPSSPERHSSALDQLTALVVEDLAASSPCVSTDLGNRVVCSSKKVTYITQRNPPESTLAQ